MSGNLLEINSIVKTFNGKTVVDCVSFCVKEGEIAALIGPNGAGKSTTMRIITGFLKADSGEVIINGENISKNSVNCKQNIGYLPEVSAEYPEITVNEYLQFIANSYNLEDINGKIVEVAKLTDISSFLNQFINSLSKGMKQRVFLAASLIHNPKILILDEPTEGLDPNQKQEIYKLLKSLAKNKAILISSHSLNEVETICHKLVLISNAKIIANETPKEFKKRTGDMYKSFSELTEAK